jgi:hypothetical protein
VDTIGKEYKSVYQNKELVNGIIAHIWICLLQLGAPIPFGANWIYLDGPM